jgi:hypothetical protein
LRASAAPVLQKLAETKSAHAAKAAALRELLDT